MESENDFDFSNPFQPEPDAHSQGRRSQASSRTAAFFSRFSRGKSSISSKSRSPRKTREKIRNKQESKPENAARSDINVDFVNPAHQISRTQNLHTFPSQSHPGMRQSTVYRAQESNASTFSLISRLRTQFAASHDDSVRWTYMGDIVKKATGMSNAYQIFQYPHFHLSCQTKKKWFEFFWEIRPQMGILMKEESHKFDFCVVLIFLKLR